MKKFKYFVLFLGLLILTSVSIYAEEWNDGLDNKEVSETNLSEINESVQEVTIAGTERTEENHYGVNKKWNITDNNMSNVMSVPYVDASLKIYDYSNIMINSLAIIPI